MADKNTRRSYAQIYVDALRRAIAELTAIERDVLDYLVSRTNEIGVCFPGIANIADGVNQRCEDVIAIIESLVGKGYVLYVRKDERDPVTRQQLPNAYQISLDYLAINPEHYASAMEINERAFQESLLSKYDSKNRRESGIITTDRKQLRSTKHLQEAPTGSTARDNHRQEAPPGTPSFSSNGSADAPSTPEGVKSGIPDDPDDHAGADTKISAGGAASAQRNESPTPSSAPPPPQKWLKAPPAAGYTEPLADDQQEALASQIYDLVVSIHGRAGTSISAARCLVYNYPLHAGLALIRLKTMRAAKPSYEIRDSMAIMTAWTRKAWQQEQAKPNPFGDWQTDTDDWLKHTQPPPEMPVSDNVTEEMRDQWRIAFDQLELQLDKASFETWVRSAKLVDYQDGVYIIAARNSYAVDALQHRLYRPVQRVFSNVVCDRLDALVELRFISPESPEVAAGD